MHGVAGETDWGNSRGLLELVLPSTLMSEGRASQVPLPFAVPMHGVAGETDRGTFTLE